MQLVEGYRIILAPRFAGMSVGSLRVRVNSGVTEAEGRFFPREDWRPISDAESTLLLSDSASTAFPHEDIALFAITGRLRTRWWDLAQSSVGSPAAADDWFALYASEVTEFARFKGLPLPTTCTLAAVVSPPGQPLMRTETAGTGPPRLAGLTANVMSPADNTVAVPGRPAPGPRVLGMINLSDEPTSILFVNLSPPRMAERLLADGPGGEPVDLWRRFLACFPDYPLVRLTIAPGEGVWFPARGIVFDGDTLDQTGVTVMLVFQTSD